MAELRDVAAFFIALGQDMAEMQIDDAMTNLRLQKFLYYAQGWSFARYKKPLFNEPIEAWQYGPVVPVCYDWYRDYGRGFLTAEKPPREVFTTQEYDLLLDTWIALSKYSTSQLVEMTHEAGTPWHKIWNRSGHSEIPAEELCTYFSALPLPEIKKKFENIHVVQPLYRKDGVPIFSAEEI